MLAWFDDHAWSVSIVNHLGHIIKQILIHILNRLAQQVNRNFLPVHNLLNFEGQLLYISIVVKAFNKQITIKTRKMIFVEVATLPAIHCNNLLALVVNVVDWGRESLSLFEGNRSNHRSGTKVELVNVEFMLYFGLKFEMGFSHSLVFHINNIVVVDPFFGFGSVAMTNETELIRSHFPHLSSIQLNILLPVGFSYGIRNLIMLQFIFKVICTKIERFIETGLEPTDHGFVVSPCDDGVIIGPMVVIIGENIHRL